MLPRCRLSAKPGRPQSPTSASSRESSCRPRVSDSGHPPVPLSCYPGSSRKARPPSPVIRPLTCYFLVVRAGYKPATSGYEDREARFNPVRTATGTHCEATLIDYHVVMSKRSATPVRFDVPVAERLASFVAANPGKSLSSAANRLVDEALRNRA